MPVYTCSMVAREGLRRHDDDAEKHREGGGGGVKRQEVEREERRAVYVTPGCVFVSQLQVKIVL